MTPDYWIRVFHLFIGGPHALPASLLVWMIPFGMTLFTGFFLYLRAKHPELPDGTRLALGVILGLFLALVLAMVRAA